MKSLTRQDQAIRLPSGVDDQPGVWFNNSRDCSADRALASPSHGTHCFRARLEVVMMRHSESTIIVAVQLQHFLQIDDVETTGELQADFAETCDALKADIL